MTNENGFDNNGFFIIILCFFVLRYLLVIDIIRHGKDEKEKVEKNYLKNIESIKA